ncbi:MAG: hypothetical protein K0R09_3891 [Clostridiales bacterium]|nr:hypothetical protein [Clostridiales bacterium]
MHTFKKLPIIIPNININSGSIKMSSLVQNNPVRNNKSPIFLSFLISLLHHSQNVYFQFLLPHPTLIFDEDNGHPKI